MIAMIEPDATAQESWNPSGLQGFSQCSKLASKCPHIFVAVVPLTGRLATSAHACMQNGLQSVRMHLLHYVKVQQPAPQHVNS